MIGMSISEGEAQKPRGTAARAGSCRGAGAVLGCRPASGAPRPPAFRGKSRLWHAVAALQHLGTCGRFPLVPVYSAPSSITRNPFTSACLLSHCLALNSRYWVAAQKILFCQKAYYIQLDVWNVNLFGIKHQ